MNSIDVLFFFLFALAGFAVFAIARLVILFSGGIDSGGGGQDTRGRDLAILVVVTVVVTGCVGYWLGASAAIGALVGSGLAALWLVPKMRSGRGGRR